MEGHSERLRRGGRSEDRRPGNLDALAHEVTEVRELRHGQLVKIRSLPFISYEDVVTCGQRLDACLEPGEEVKRPRIDGLLRNGLHKGEQVLGAMIDLAQKKLDLLLMLLAFGYVGCEGDDI